MRGLPHAIIGASTGVFLSTVLPGDPSLTTAIDGARQVLRELPFEGLVMPYVNPALPYAGAIMLGAVAAAGALMPDLDHEGAMASKFPIVGPLASMMVRLTSNIFSQVRPVPNPYPEVIAGDYLTHRGPFHSPLLAILIYLVLVFVGAPGSFLLAGFLGYLSHLAADEPTRMGLPLFWPFYARVVRLPRWLSWRSGTFWIEWPLAAAAAYLSLSYIGVATPLHLLFQR